MWEKRAFLLLISMTISYPLFAEKKTKILFLGDSLTAGYGLSADKSYPALIQKKIEAENWPYEVINGGRSGDTTAGGLERLPLVFSTKGT